MVDVTRRGFLGLFGATIVAVALPKVPALTSAPIDPVDPFALKPPTGWTWQWIATEVMGQPETKRLEQRLANGWTFVDPTPYPGVPQATLHNAIASLGLILVEKPTRIWLAEQRKILDANLARQNVQIAVDTPDGLQIQRKPCKPPHA